MAPGITTITTVQLITVHPSPSSNAANVVTVSTFALTTIFISPTSDSTLASSGSVSGPVTSQLVTAEPFSSASGVSTVVSLTRASSAHDSSTSFTAPSNAPLALSNRSTSTIRAGPIAGGVVSVLIVFLAAFVVLFRKRRKQRAEGRSEPLPRPDQAEEIHPYPLLSPTTAVRGNRISRKWETLASGSSSLRASPTPGVPANPASHAKTPVVSVRQTENPEPLVVHDPSAIIDLHSTAAPSITDSAARDSDQETILIEALRSAVEHLNAVQAWAERTRQLPPPYQDTSGSAQPTLSLRGS
ncbi:hypothetical protein PUNSTDRAFT_145446 [Punctularia strigosozonata HHB-11173 SS5]|uniref:uncharacterized protein n=1 Tax=Punctularia strigosozonata (strain HHB-11173) TaxID=741275 RepID=UPI0004416DE6|nr:uncharacterized protein PUNSTDRAFT_145446 [Punctularia strigosozonata HHB-11173 SS5]EIN06085.1 hypothetical protein PUNSTDRAFT_145446 [Punctularia strigosozonata HHB-11173 SS5]